MTRIVYNACYGGFGLSTEAADLYQQLSGIESFYDWELSRTDPILLQVIDELGLEEASGSCARLFIRELPEGTRYRIDEYDGLESVIAIDEYDWSVA